MKRLHVTNNITSFYEVKSKFFENANNFNVNLEGESISKFIK
jgi:hypothetical protein